MNKIIKKLIICFILFSSLPAISAKFREINSTSFENEIPVVQTEDINSNAPHMPSFETINAVKDGNEKLYGVVGKSQVLSFDKNIERISLTDEKIAEVVVLSPKQVLINGKTPGNTSIIFWSEGSTKPVFYNLVIQQNADAFIQAVEYIAPNENVSLVFNDNGAVLTGAFELNCRKRKNCKPCKSL